MKRFQLFILSVFIMLLWSQKTIAVSQYEYGVEKLDSGVWYSVFTSEKTLGENFNFYYNYPSTSFSFEAKGSRKRNIIGQWKYHYKFNVCHSAIPNNKSAFFSKNNTSENENFNWGESTSYETNKTSDNYNNYKWFNTTINSTDARCIVFIKDGDESRYIKNIKVKIAPHTKLNTTSLSFNTAITDPATNPDGESQTIDFYSFLSGSNGIQISIVNVKDKNGNPITIDSLSLSKTSITADTLEKIGENNHSFSLSFKPTQIIENATCSIKIENKGAAIGSELYIPVTLNSSLATPTLTCNEFGYKYAKLSWEAIDGAEKYNIYDGETKVKTIIAPATSVTITDLEYGSSHSYTITSVVGTAESNPSNVLEIILPTCPTPTITSCVAEQEQITINWSNASLINNNHKFFKYHVRITPGSGDVIKIEDNTYTFSGLTDNTEYTIEVGIEYQYTLDGKTHNDNSPQCWSTQKVTTSSFITNGEVFDGAKKYKGVWYRVNLGTKIDISDGSAAIGGIGFESEQKPFVMNLNYPCEKDFEYKYSASYADLGLVNAWGTATLRIQESTNESKEEPKWSRITNNEPKEVKEEYKPGTASTTGGVNVKRLEFYENTGEDGKANGKAYISDIWLEIVPHILLKGNKYTTIKEETATKTTNAVVKFGEIEIGSSKAVDIDFKSFLSKGDLKAKLIDDTDKEIFWLNSVRATEEYVIAGDNTLETINSNDSNVTISFNPTSAGKYTGKLEISDKQNTVIIDLEAECIKKTPEISWINDKYISLGDFLYGAAFSTLGSVRYEYANPNADNSSITIVNNSLKAADVLGEVNAVAIKAIVDETANYYRAESTETFIVTDKIIQTISWDQEFTDLKFEDSGLELTAKAINRATGEENGNEIIYSSADENVVRIVDGNKLEVVGSGYTYITARQEGNDEYTPAEMTKLVLIRQILTNCSDNLVTKDYSYQFGDIADGDVLETIFGGWDWGPFPFEKEWNTMASKLSFSTSKHTSSTSHNLTITDDLGNIIYNKELGIANNEISLDKDVRKLNFEMSGNLRVEISNIKITPLVYLEADLEEDNKVIEFSDTEVDFNAVREVSFDWANQPGYMWATIIEDDFGVFSVDNRTAIFGTTECNKFGTSDVKVLFSPKKEATYTAKLAIYVGDAEAPACTIPIIGYGTKAKQDIYWLDVDHLTTADKEVNVAYTTASAQQPITYTIMSGGDVVKLDGNTITVLKEGSFSLTAQQLGNESYLPTEVLAEKTFTASIGNIIFDNKANNKDWNTIGNWLPVSNLNKQRNVEPSAVVNAVITAEAVISNAERNEINNLTFKTGGKLTIGATSGLKANAVNGATATNLILEASADGNAAFTYASGTPSATVKMHSKAEGGVANGTPQWQYMGVAVNNVDENNCAKASNFSGAWLLKWEESENTTGDPWSDKPLAGETGLVPWAGYSITQPTAATYTMSGQLMNGDHTYTLTRTTRNEETQDPDCGFNLLANSYTAPIDITKLKIDSFKNADACIVLYNTGTYGDWEKGQTDETNPEGQLTVIPVEAAKAISEEQGLPTTIPSMQAFFVMAKEGGGTFTVDYETAVLGAANMGNQMRAPEAREEFNVLKIMIEGENSRDRLYLLENENTSEEYDNGYEARKIFDAPRGHQMYATCQYGYASIDCSESFIGQTIGLKGDNEGEQLTISFDTDRLKYYNSLYLYDKATGKYVNITAGEKYTFFGIKGADDNRFSIVTNPDDENQTPPFVVIGEELAFDKSQINTDNANIYIYDTSGRLLIMDKINPYENYNIPNMPNGIYLVNMNGYTTKIVKK